MINEIEIQKDFFHPVCNGEEIERIFCVQNAQDYLLKLRAETIVDHMRLFRVYRNKALIDEKNWSLERSFDASHYEAFLGALSDQCKYQCNAVAYGNIFSNDPNGSIFKTDYGPIITTSDSLKFFLKFMHLALLNFETNVPDHVRVNSLRIAIKVMLKTEALDFFMDPRGIVPEDVANAMRAPIDDQMLFIAGHEFAHYILGDISDNSVIDKPIYFAISLRDKEYKPMKVYNQSQDQEFEADIQSLRLPKYNQEQYFKIFEASLLWFGCLQLYEAVCDTICPKNPWDYSTHPTAKERFDHIIDSGATPGGFDKSKWEMFIEHMEQLKEFLVNDASTNIEFYEMYGSTYLDKPNTDWRGPELKDRVDYY